MKKSLKVILTLLLVLATVASLVSMLFSILLVVGESAVTITNMVSFFKYQTDNFGSITRILYIVSSVLSLCVSLALIPLFLLIAVACVAGVIYVFIGGNDKRLKELESVINDAYAKDSNMDAASTTDSKSKCAEIKSVTADQSDIIAEE